MAHSFVLQQPEFDALLAWLAPTREQAGERYELIRHRLLRYFEGHQCVPADEHVDDTIDRVARRLASGEQVVANDPLRYFYGVARNVIHEYRRHQAVLLTRNVTSLFEPPRATDLSCLSRCWRTLTPRAQQLLAAYYGESRTALAAREGVSPNALRLRVFKERQKLRACIVDWLHRRQH